MWFLFPRNFCRYNCVYFIEWHCKRPTPVLNFVSVRSTRNNGFAIESDVLFCGILGENATVWTRVLFALKRIFCYYSYLLLGDVKTIKGYYKTCSSWLTTRFFSGDGLDIICWFKNRMFIFLCARAFIFSLFSTTTTTNKVSAINPKHKNFQFAIFKSAYNHLD